MSWLEAGRWFAFYMGFVAGAATALATSANGHMGCRGECFDSCLATYQECIEPCGKMPDGKEREECFSRCARTEATCEEHCDEKHHDPSC